MSFNRELLEVLGAAIREDRVLPPFARELRVRRPQIRPTRRYTKHIVPAFPLLKWKRFRARKCA